MADILRIVSGTDNGKAPVVVQDISDGTFVSTVRDSLTVSAPNPLRVSAGLGGRWGGQRTAGESYENGQVSVRLLVRGSSKDDSLARISRIAKATDVRWRGYYLEWRPDGATRSTFFELRGPAGWELGYRWIVFQATGAIELGVNFQVAPLALGPAMDVWDDFGVDRMALDYTPDAGAISDVAVALGNLTAVANLTTEKRFTHTGRGYTHPDGQYSIRATPGTTVVSLKAGRYFKRTAANTYLEAYVDDNSIFSRLRIDKVVSGTRTNLANTNLATRVLTGASFWVRGRIEGNRVTAEHFTSEPADLAATPTTSATTVLSGSDQTAFGYGVAGSAGVVWTPQSSNALLDDYRDLPYTYSRTLPDDIDLLGVPGDAPALMDLNIGTTASSNIAAGKFATIGWSKLPRYNFFYNGDFEDTSSASLWWTTAAVANIQAAANVFTRIAQPSKFGSAYAEVNTPGVAANEGVSQRIFHRFRAGQPYTVQMWAKGTAGNQVQAIIGSSSANDTSVSATATLGPAWQLVTTTWTPTADRNDAHAGMRSVGTATVTIQMDGVCVYEGTPANVPTLTRQAEGAGAYPPLGVVEMEAFINATADASARSGQVWRTAASGAGVLSGPSFYLDPALILADDFQTDLSIEVYVRALIPTTVVSPTAVLLGDAYAGQAAIGPPRYSQEYGTQGSLVLTSNTPQIFRFGTLVIPADVLRSRSRWIVQPTIKVSAGSSGNVDWDYMFVVPSQRRASTLTGKATSTLPTFLNNSSLKVIKTDLTTAWLEPTIANSGEAIGASMGGALLEIEPGDVRISALFTIGVPGDPNTPALDATQGTPLQLHASIVPRFRILRGQ